MSEEHALIARAVGGEAEALERLAALHRPGVLRTATHLLGDTELAEDVAQEALLRLCAALPGFRGDSGLGTWLHRITLNLCRDQLRRRRHASLDSDSGAAKQARSLGVESDPGGEVDRARARSAVREAIDRLPEDQRRALELRYDAHLPYAEIAARLEIPQGTAATRIYRALKRLGEEIDPRNLELIR